MGETSLKMFVLFLVRIKEKLGTSFLSLTEIRSLVYEKVVGLVPVTVWRLMVVACLAAS